MEIDLGRGIEAEDEARDRGVDARDQREGEHGVARSGGGIARCGPAQVECAEEFHERGDDEQRDREMEDDEVRTPEKLDEVFNHVAVRACV